MTLMFMFMGRTAMATATANAITDIDLADDAMSSLWIHHVTVGEPSFDDFVHSPHNPVFKGSAAAFGGCEWSVNGFLYGGHSPNQTLYVGLYATGYLRPDSMLALASTDDGTSWSSPQARGKCEPLEYIS